MQYVRQTTISSGSDDAREARARVIELFGDIILVDSISMAEIMLMASTMDATHEQFSGILYRLMPLRNIDAIWVEPTPDIVSVRMTVQATPLQIQRDEEPTVVQVAGVLVEHRTGDAVLVAYDNVSAIAITRSTRGFWK